MAKLIIGKNDLETLNNDIALEWDYERNAPLTPKDVTPNSNKVVWWKCKEGHVFKNSHYNEVQESTGSRKEYLS